MMRLRFSQVLCIAYAALAGAQVPTKARPPHLHLLGGGRACTGELRLTFTELRWTTSFSRCRAPYKLLSQATGEWLLEITPAQSSDKVCPYKFVEIRNTDPSYRSAQWEATSYTSLEDRAATPKHPVYACTMQKLE